MQYHDRTSPMTKHVETMAEAFQISGAPLMPQMFGNAGIEHMKKYGRCHVAFLESVIEYVENDQLLHVNISLNRLNLL